MIINVVEGLMFVVGIVAVMSIGGGVWVIGELIASKISSKYSRFGTLAIVLLILLVLYLIGTAIPDGVLLVLK